MCAARFKPKSDEVVEVSIRQHSCFRPRDLTSPLTRLHLRTYSVALCGVDHRQDTRRCAMIECFTRCGALCWVRTTCESKR